MELRTTFRIDPSPHKISYSDPVMFIGSCFANSIGEIMLSGRMPVLINPSGTVYNPVSVCNTLNEALSGKESVKEDLYFNEGTYHSLFHHTEFSSSDPVELLRKINKRSMEALAFLKTARYLFLTFGTARVYRLKKSGVIVSNCHRIPSENFQSELLSVEEITSLWSQKLDHLHSLFPLLKIIFTVSPVRHWKDGPHGNQISKSILLLAIEELLKHPVQPYYFPAYEIVMDDLRDYRFYADDMLHPSSPAIKYIWKAFSECFFDNPTIDRWNEIVKITKACQHRFNTDSKENIARFAENMIKQITALENKGITVDLSAERSYFLGLLR